jgi:TonB family protein
MAMQIVSIISAATCLVLLAANANGNPSAASDNTLVAEDIHGKQSHCPRGKPPGWLADAITKSGVEYPEWGKNHHEQGTGVFRMIVDPTSGKVTKVMAIKSTSFRDLDDAAVTALGRWRWKPGTWKEADVEINFDMAKGAMPHAGLPGIQTPNAPKPPAHY